MGKDGMIIEIGDVIRVIEAQPINELPDLDNRAVVLTPEWKCQNGKRYVCEATRDKMKCECKM